MWKILLVLFLLPSFASGIPDAPVGLTAGDPSWTLVGTLQDIIYDDGTEGWLVDPFVGNFVTKSIWYGGPRLEVGGMHVTQSCVQGEGKMYCSFGPDGTRNVNVVQIDETTGVARLLLHWTGAYVGDSEDVQGGSIFYNSYDSTLYVLGPNCLRKVVNDGDGTHSVELVAGECGTACVSDCDGTGLDARFKLISGWAALSDGNMYMLESDELRKITPAGVVTTLNLTRPESPSTLWTLPEYSHIDFLSPGDDANTLYLADASNENVAAINLSTNVITRILGVTTGYDPYGRRGTRVDGPALTHASMTGGAKGRYSAFYASYLVDSYDSLRLRRLAPDGWVKTNLLSKRPGTIPTPYDITMAQGTGGVLGEQANITKIGLSSPICNIAGVDDRGGVYIRYSRDLNGIWRAYNPREGGTQ